MVSAGMVQLCSRCMEKHSHLAKTETPPSSIEDGKTPSSDGNNKLHKNYDADNIRFKVSGWTNNLRGIKVHSQKPHFCRLNFEICFFLFYCCTK